MATDVKAKREKESYFALVSAHPIRPIRSEDELDKAIEVVEHLFCRSKPLNKHEQDYLDVLAHEIERYESKVYPLPKVSAAAMLRHLIDAKGVTLTALAEATRISVSTLSAVVNGKRKLNLAHIAELAPYFGVEAGVFLN